MKYSVNLFVLLATLSANAKDIKILAKVGQDIITGSDIARKNSYLKVANGSALPENKVLELLIDEKIQNKIALDNGYSVSKAEINSAFTGLAENNGATAGQFASQLAGRGIPLSVMVDNLENQMLWQKVVYSEARGKVKATDSEVDAKLAEITKKSSASVMELSEIVVTVSGSKAATQAKVDKVYNDLIGGADFATKAKAVSESPTAAKGGFIGVIDERGLSGNPLGSKLKGAAANTVLKPIYDDATASFRIMKVGDKKSVGPKITRKQAESIVVSEKLDTIGKGMLEEARKNIYIKRM
jgi:peptidyl-prolyl cis-trans isomerase SurA